MPLEGKYAKMSIDLKYRVNIERPVKTVCAAITDIPSIPKWFSIKEVRNVSNGPLAVGTTFQVVSDVMGSERVLDYRVTAFDPCKTFAFCSDGKAPTAITMLLEPAEGGTRLTFVFSLKVSRLVAPLIKGKVSEQLEHDLARLARMIEAES